MTSSDHTPSTAAADDEAAVRARNTRRIINGMLLGTGGVVLAFILFSLGHLAQFLITAQ